MKQINFPFSLVYVFLLVLSFSLNVSGQTWNWWADGYVGQSGGGIYTNVDGQGTKMKITGLIEDSESGEIGQECVRIGIDNQESEGIQHKYTFKFTDPVNVRFKVSRLNFGPPCYNDFLSFTGSPHFSNPFEVTVSGNEIIPLKDYPIEGFVTVSYYSVKDFTITHGKGTGCNPGHIEICELDFYIGSTSTTKNQVIENITLYPNPTQGEFSIKNDNDESIDAKVLDIIGRLIFEQSIPSKSTAFFDLSNHAQGMYIVLFENKKSIIESKKLVIQQE